MDATDYASVVVTGSGTPPVTLHHSGVGNRYYFTGSRLVLHEDHSQSGVAPNLQVQYNRARWYDPALGRWLQRDPAEYVDGMNLYEYVRGGPATGVDPLGMWEKDIHQDATYQLALDVGYRNSAAIAISAHDIGTDGGKLGLGTGFTPFYGDQSRHFNRNAPGQRDSRLDWLDMELAAAKYECRSNDAPRAAAKHLGRALHSIQDWWSHGDYSAGPSDTAVPHLSKYDDPEWDAQTPSGRAPQVFWQFPRTGVDLGSLPAIKFVHPVEVRYENWVPGNKRITGTTSDTEMWLRHFLYSVDAYGGCKCKEFFISKGRND